MAIKIYSPNKTEVRGGPGEGTKNNPFYWYGKLADPANTGVTGTFNNYDSFDEMNYTADPIWVRVYLDAGTTYQIGHTVWDAVSIYDDEFNSVAKAGSNEREIAGVNCYYSIDFTPEKSGVYFLSVGVTNGYPEEFKVACSPSPNSVDTVPEYYDYQLTSKGFDNIGKYHGFNNLKDAGLLPLLDDKLLCRFTFDGENPLVSTNGKYSLTNTNGEANFVLSDSKALGLGKCAMTYRLTSNLPFPLIVNDTDFTIMCWLKVPNQTLQWGGISRYSFSLFGGSVGGNGVALTNDQAQPYITINYCQDDNNWSNPSGGLISSVPYTLDEWFHFCYVRRGRELFYFQNGKLSAYSSDIGMDIKEYRADDSYTLNIGHQHYDLIKFCIDDLRIYHRAVFTENFAPPLK